PDQQGKRDENEQEIFALQGKGRTALKVFQPEEHTRSNRGKLPVALNCKIGDGDECGEDQQIENAQAKRTKVADNAEQIVSDVRARHLKVEDVAVGHGAALHEENFVEQRRGVVRGSP